MSDAGTSEEIVAALGRPETYAHGSHTVLHHETHLSHVFVAGGFAYKLKKSVRYSFADFSTAELRLAACREELRLNRRLCAPLYLGILPVHRRRDGSLHLGAPLPDGRGAGDQERDGEALDHVVWMRALPPDGMGRVALRRGRLTPALLDEFGRTLARFHTSLGPAAIDGSIDDAVERRWTAVLADAAPMAGRYLSRPGHEILADHGPAFVRRHASLFRARLEAGRVRDGHGDLHLGNLCLVDRALPGLDGAPEVPAGLYAFDCLEFSRELRVGDVASEVAFLAMDLEVEERPDLARAFVDAYLRASADPDLELLLPFFVCHRAAIRGMVHGLAAASPTLSEAERSANESSSRTHFALALRQAWRSAGPAVIACAGLSGSGKTTVALALARATGFPLLSSDELRKRRAGLDPRSPAPTAAGRSLYTPRARHETYLALADLAAEHLGRGESVVVDATFNRTLDRAPLVSAARRSRCPILFVECRCDADTARRRLAARATQPASDPSHPARSDADWSVREQQEMEHEALGGDEPHIVLDTVVDPASVADAALRRVWEWRRLHEVRRPACRAGPEAAASDA